MEKIIKPSRIVCFAIFLVLLLVIYGFTLYKLQIVEGEEHLEDSIGSFSTEEIIYAARGSVLDRDGELMVSDRTVYNIKISRAALLEQDDPSGIILRLVNAAREYGVSYNDTFPVTITAPFEYDVGASDTQLSRLNSYIEYFSSSLTTEMSAQDLIIWMRDHYKIDYAVAAEDARRIMGVRYEIELRAIINITDYIFAEDVSVDFITYLSEQDFPCVTIETTSERQYHTTYAAHLLGYIGRMTRDEYNNIYKEQGYPLNSYVGKSGVEYAFEEYLHGKEGSVTTYKNSDGAVINEEIIPAEAGSNIYLTIDLDLQREAEDSLAAAITQINKEREAEAEEGREAEEAGGGAIVAIDVKSGDVLALASYPTFNLATFGRDASLIFQDESQPLFNRATHGTFNPGSTFKMVTALAGLNSQKIASYTKVEDEGKYTAYEGYQPTCWIYLGEGSATHGKLDVIGALENSCNYFFYWLGDKLGADAIADTAKMFGFGSSTGIEIGDKAGTVATPEYKQEALNEGWWAADTLLSSIGQSHNYYTPIQLANYAAAIANGGTLYSASILKYVADYDYSDVILEKDPEILNIIDDSFGYIGVLQEGMEAVAKTGTAASAFKNYPIPVAAKTGTVQSDSASMNTAVFVCYAPADNPEIAIAVVVEKGGSGSALTTVAQDLLDVYFADTEDNQSVQNENSPIK